MTSAGLFDVMSTPYYQNQLRFFIDGSKYSLKSALLYNGNEKSSILIAHKIQAKQCYDTMRKICVHLKGRRLILIIIIYLHNIPIGDCSLHTIRIHKVLVFFCVCGITTFTIGGLISECS